MSGSVNFGSYFISSILGTNSKVLNYIAAENFCVCTCGPWPSSMCRDMENREMPQFYSAERTLYIYSTLSWVKSCSCTTGAPCSKCVVLKSAGWEWMWLNIACTVDCCRFVNVNLHVTLFVQGPVNPGHGMCEVQVRDCKSRKAWFSVPMRSFGQ